MIYDKNNIFAKILRSEIPCNKVYEDDFNLGFYDVNPQAKIHILVIPKGEYIDFNDFMEKASGQEVESLFKSVRTISKELDIAKEGFRVITNKGKNAGQEVPHFHIHILAGEKLSVKLA